MEKRTKWFKPKRATTMGATIVVLVFVLSFAFSALWTVDNRHTAVINTDGLWSIETLGVSHQTVQLEGAMQTSPPVQFRLPRGSSQGPRVWYLVHLHFVVELDDRSSDGLAYVAADTNGYTAALIRVRALGYGQGYVFDAADLLNGSYGWAVLESNAEVRYTNYLQIAGVTPGDNSLSYKLEQRDTLVRKVTILPDSGIIRTSTAPMRQR